MPHEIANDFRIWLEAKGWVADKLTLQEIEFLKAGHQRELQNPSLAGTVRADGSQTGRNRIEAGAK